jgi:hypothetical protein
MTDNVVAVEITANAAGAVAGAKDAGVAIRTISPAVLGVAGDMKGLGEVALASFERMVLGAQSARIAVVELGESVAAAKAMVSEIGELMLAAFAVEAVAKFAENMGELAEKTVHTAQTFGMTATEVQRLNAQATLYGVPVDALSGAMQRLDKAFAAAKAGGTAQAAALKQAGVDIQGSYTGTQLLSAALEGLGKMESGPAKVAAAMAIFGRNIRALGPLLSMTSAQVEEANKTIDAYGAVSDAAAAKGLALAESQNEGKVAMMGLNNVLTDALAPILKDITDGLNHMVGAFTASYNSGGLAKIMLDWVAIAIKNVTSVGIILGYAFAQTGAVIKFVVTEIVDWVGGLARVIGGLLPHVTFIGDAFNAVAPVVQGVIKAIIGWVEDLAHAIGKLLTSLPLVGKTFAKMGEDGKKSLGEMKAAAEDALVSLRKVWAGDESGAKLPGAGGGTTKDDPGPKAKKGKGDAGGESDMTALQALFDQRQAANTTMLTNMKADELAYWSAVKTNAQGGALSQVDADRVAMKVLVLKHELAMSAIEEEQAAAKREAADAVTSINRVLGEKRAAVEQQIRLTEDQESKGEISHATARARIEADINALVAMEQKAALDIEAAHLKADAAVMASSAKNTKQYKEALADQWNQYAVYQAALTKADADGNRARLAQDQRTIDQTVKAWTTGTKGIVDDWVSGTRKMLQGTQTWQQFELQMWNKVLDGVVAMVEKMVMSWIGAEAKKVAATELGNTLRTADNAKAALDGGAIDFLATMKATTNAAVKAASGAYAAMAGIPIVGPELGAAAAGVTFVAVEAIGAMASASGGYDIPSGVNPVTQLHAQEMVLPATLANPMRAMLANGGQSPGAQGSGGGRADSGDHYHVTVHAFDAPGVERMMRGPAGDALVRGLVAKRRNLQGAGVT